MCPSKPLVGTDVADARFLNADVDILDLLVHSSGVVCRLNGFVFAA